MKKFLLSIGIASGSIFYIIIGILGLVIHLWTILLSWGSNGIVAAIIALSLPVISEIFWFFKSWNTTGSFFNTYTIAILVYVVLWVSTVIILGFFTNKISKEDEM